MVDLLFTLALFCVFAASALMVVLIGANVYKRAVRQMDENFASRTSVTYVATKLRQNDVENGVSVVDFDGVPALLLSQEIDGDVYETRIYHYNGYLRELFALRGNPISLEGGQVILEVPQFTIVRSGKAVVLSSTDSDNNVTRHEIIPRCGLGAGEEEAGA